MYCVSVFTCTHNGDDETKSQNGTFIKERCYVEMLPKKPIYYLHIYAFLRQQKGVNQLM